MPTVPTPATFTAGTAPTAGDLNSVSAAAGFPLQSRPIAVLWQNNAQNLTSGTYTNVVFDGSDEIDSDSGHPSGGNSYTVATTGWYLLCATVSFNSASGGGVRVMQFTVGGTAQPGRELRETAGTQTVSMSLSRIRHLFAGQVLAVQAMQNSGGTITTNVTGERSTLELIWLRS